MTPNPHRRGAAVSRESAALLEGTKPFPKSPSESGRGLRFSGPTSRAPISLCSFFRRFVVSIQAVHAGQLTGFHPPFPASAPRRCEVSGGGRKASQPPQRSKAERGIRSKSI